MWVSCLALFTFVNNANCRFFQPCPVLLIINRPFVHSWWFSTFVFLKPMLLFCITTTVTVLQWNIIDSMQVPDLGQICNCFGWKYFSVHDWSCLVQLNLPGGPESRVWGYLMGCIPPDKLSKAYKCILIQINYIFHPGLLNLPDVVSGPKTRHEFSKENPPCLYKPPPSYTEKGAEEESPQPAFWSVVTN